MINFYQTWKDDKDSEVKVKKNTTNRCKICNKAVNGLKDHVREVHGKDIWSRYIAAEAKMKQQELERFRNIL